MKKLALTLVLVVLAASLILAVDPAVALWAKWVKENYGGTTITIAAANHPSIEAMKKMTSDFEALTGIKVKWECMEEIHLHDKILLEFSSNTKRYDIIMLDVTWLGEFVSKNVVVPLDDYINSDKTPAFFDYEDIIPAYREGLGKFQGTIYGIPSAGESAFIAYNKEILDKYDISPSELNSYDSLLNVAQELASKKRLYGIAMRGRRGHHIVYSWLQFFYPFGARIFDENWNCLLDSPESIASLEYYVELMKTAPKGISSFSHEEATSAIMQGLVGLWFDATALAPWIEDSSRSIVAGKVGYLAPPAGPKGDYACVAGWNLALSEQSTKKDVAWQFIVYMLSRKMAPTYIANGGVVTRTSILDDPFYQNEFSYFPAVKESLDKAYNLIREGVDWRPRIPEWPQIGEIMGLEASLALSGKKTPKEACKDAKAEVEKLMKESGY